MNGRRVLVVIVLLAVMVPLAASAAKPPTVHQARLSDFPTFVFATIADGHLRGSIAAVQRSPAPSSSVFTSLHGLTPSKDYRGMITDLGCNKAATSADSILDLMAIVHLDADEDDLFEQKTGHLSERLARAKTVRIFEGGRQIACAKANRVR